MNVFSYKNEKDGALVHEISPILNLEKSISSHGRGKFIFHTDGAYLSREVRPSTLSLMRLVNEGNVATEITSLRGCLSELSQEEINILSDRNYIHNAPESFNVEVKTCQSSVLDKVNGFYEIKGAFHSTKAIGAKAEAALNSLKLALNKNKIVNNWRPGDLVILNNLKTMHGRGEVIGKRWLHRCYGSYYFPSAKVVNL